MFFLAETVEQTPSKFETVVHNLIVWASTSGVKLIIALLILFFSFKFINFFMKKLYKKLHKKQVDETIARVSTSAIKVCLKVLIFLSLVNYVGIETASITALIASLGVGLSLAIQGTLSNFAGGVIIIVMRPFRIGDFITSNGESGTVEDIKLFYTHIVTPDNKQIMIPNGTLANNVIVNFSTKENRRVDETFSIAYGSDVDLAKTLIYKVIERHDNIHKDPEPFVKLVGLGASSLDISVKVWVKNADYWDVKFKLINEVKEEFDKNGIEIPYNKLDVNIKKEIA